MKRVSIVILLTSILAAFPSWARAGDDEDISIMAHEFFVDLALVNAEKLASLCRPEDAAVIPKLDNNGMRLIHEIQDTPQVKDIRRQLIDESIKVISFTQPVYAPDRASASVTGTPVSAEARKFCELMELYEAYMKEALRDKGEGKPLPKVEDVRARILAPGSPEQQEIEQHAAVLPLGRPTLKFEKTAVGWRVNLRAFFASPPGTP